MRSLVSMFTGPLNITFIIFYDYIQVNQQIETRNSGSVSHIWIIVYACTLTEFKEGFGG